MANVFIINAHQPYPFSEGRLNATLVQQAQEYFTAQGHETRITTMTDDWDTDAEIATHQWADTILVQSPVNWMGVPWLMKKYMDQVYTFGMDGRLCDGDGRTRSDPSKQYGTGGTLTGKTYMLSLTFNAPKDCFNDDKQYLFEGAGVDELWLPMHANFKFFGMTALPTFVCYDVLKNPDVENDFKRWESHLAEQYSTIVGA